MESLIITPKNKVEQKLLSDLLAKMNVKVAVLTDEAKEDLGLATLLKEADRTKKVSKETIMSKLRG